MVGYPPDFKSKKKGQYSFTKAYARGNVVDVEIGPFSLGEGRYISEEQYQQFITTSSSNTLGSNNTNNTNNTSGDFQANMIGILAHLSSIFSHEWIIDLGASHHITPYKECLFNPLKLEGCERNKVQVPTGGRCEVTHKGTTAILRDHRLKNVLYVPDFKYNLLSVSKMTKDLLLLNMLLPRFLCFPGPLLWQGLGDW